MDVKDNSTASGAYIQQYTVASGGGNNQRWRLDDAGSGYYYIKVKSTQMCLATLNAGTGNGTQVIQQTCNSTTAQMWKLTTLSSGVYEISLYNTTEALDVTNNSTSDGANIQIYAFTGSGGSNQKWTFTQVEATKSTSDSYNTDNLYASDEISLFPNPASDYITIRQNKNSEITDIEVFDLSGTTVLKYQAGISSEMIINISNLKAGIYVIRMNCKNDNVYTKFVKQ